MLRNCSTLRTPRMWQSALVLAALLALFISANDVNAAASLGTQATVTVINDDGTRLPPALFESATVITRRNETGVAIFRGASGDIEPLIAWAEECRLSPNEPCRGTISVTLLDRASSELRTFNLLGTFPISFAIPPDSDPDPTTTVKTLTMVVKVNRIELG